MQFLLNRRDAGSVLAPKIGQVATLNIPQMAAASGGVLRTIDLLRDRVHGHQDPNAPTKIAI